MANFDDRGVIDALNNIAQALENVAYQLKCLGNGNAATEFGALEAYGMHMGAKMDALSRTISEGFESLSTSITFADTGCKHDDA